jgi:hypothetical protein
MTDGGPEFLPRSTLAGRPLPFSSAVRIGDILYMSGQMGFGETVRCPRTWKARRARRWRISAAC